MLCSDRARALRRLTIRILHGDDFRVFVEIMEERAEDPPAGVELVVADEVRVIPLQGVEDQRFVGFRDFDVGETTSVGQVQFRGDCLHAQTGQLRVHLDVDGLVWLDADDELVPRDVLKYARRDVPELDSDLRFLLIQGCSGECQQMVIGLRPRLRTFACLQYEGDAVPSFVLDESHHGAKCRAS